MPVLSLSVTKVVFFQFQTTFSSLAAFLSTTPTFLEKWVWFPGAEFNSESIGTNFKFQNSQIKKLVWQFLFALFCFWPNLINFTFLFWEIHSWPVGSRKISRNRGKKIRRLSPVEAILEPKQKKRYFIIYIHSLWKNFKNSYRGSRVMRMCHFGAQNGPFAPNKKFFGKLLISFSSTY